MIELLKRKFYELLTALGYSVTDSGNFEEDFPWLMLSTNNFSRFELHGLSQQIVSLKLDIFSCYNGEKETLDIINNICDHLPGFIAENDFIIWGLLSQSHILGDKETGPVRKHGVAIYKFVLASGLTEEVNNNDSAE